MADLTSLKRLLARIPGLRPLVLRIRGRLPESGRAYARWRASATRYVPLSRASGRGAPPAVDTEALRAAFSADPLAAEADTFVLYRILGNDLPPRHRDGQTRKNLAFLLEHEPDLPACEKRFILNRIVDPREEEALTRLLEDAGASFLRIPFDVDAYRSVPWDIAGVPPEYAPWTRRFSLLSEERQARVLMRLYRHKNNYAMNNNGARNAALEEGRRLAKWVLPWDGNCFVTAEAWREIVSTVRSEAHLPCFLVPMARITDNGQLLDAGFRPPAKEEPQLLFRRDARLAFDPAFFYGRRPKVELLWRLGVPGDWDEWGIEPWDLPCPPFADEAGAYGRAGWVARLFSGHSHLEAGAERVVSHRRKTARNLAIQNLLDELDDARACREGTKPLLIDPDPRAMLKGGLGERLRMAVQAVSANGNDGARGAFDTDGHSIARPRGSLIDRLRRGTGGAGGYTLAQRLFEDVFMLTLGWRHRGDPGHAQQALRLLRAGFMNPATALAPVAGAKASAVADMIGVCLLPDALRLLQTARVLGVQELGAVRDWLARYLDWLRDSEPGREAREAPHSLGTCHDLQLVAIAACLGETRLWRTTLRDSRLRLAQQFGVADMPSMPESGPGSDPGPNPAAQADMLDERCFNLQVWMHLARIAASLGEDLWSCGGADGPFLRGALDAVLRDGDSWQGRGNAAFDPVRLHPLHHARLRYYGSEGIPEPRLLLPMDEIEALFSPAHGILPFWQLAHGHRAKTAALTQQVVHG